VNDEPELNDPTTNQPRRAGSFGMRRKHYVIIRVALAVGIVVIGLTLHHHGGAYDAIRGVYFVVILALVVWRIRNRRSGRRG
jgi:Flp pilus assembly protein TadB